MSTLSDYRDLFRLKHWVKNTFVFMPLPFALAAGGHFDAAHFALGLFGFCLATSAVYALNDVLDAEQDRRHPEKQRRPVASGRITALGAVVAAVALLGG